MVISYEIYETIFPFIYFFKEGVGVGQGKGLAAAGVGGGEKPTFRNT